MSLTTPAKPAIVSEPTAQAVLQHLTKMDRARAMRSVDGMRTLLGNRDAVRRVRRGAVHTLMQSAPHTPLSEFKQVARDAQAAYIADVANQMASLVDPRHGRPRSRRVSLSPAQRRDAKLPARSNVPAWAQYLPSAGTILELPTALPFEEGVTPTKKVVKTDRRPVSCIFCGSNAKERGPEMSYDICSECYKIGKADAERAYIQGHPEAGRAAIRHVQTLALINLLSNARPDLKSGELRPLARKMVDRLHSPSLDVIYPELANRIRTTAAKAATGYILPHPEATEAQLASIQPFPNDITRKALAYAIRENVQYSYAQDPHWNQAVRVMAARRKAANGIAGSNTKVPVLPPVDLLDRNFASTYVENKSPSRNRSVGDEAGYDGQFEDPELSDSGISQEAIWDRYATATPTSERPVIVADEALLQDEAYLARKARIRQVKERRKRQTGPRRLRNDVRAAITGAQKVAIAGNKSRTPTAGMAVDRVSFLSEIEAADFRYLSNDAIDTDIHREALQEGETREVAEANWQRIRAGKATIAEMVGKGDMPSQPLFPRLRTPSSARIGTDETTEAWDAEVDAFLRDGSIGKGLEAAGVNGKHINWANGVRGELLPRLTGDQLYTRVPHPEIETRRTRAALELENDAGVDVTQYGFRLSGSTFTRTVDGVEVEGADRSFARVATDHDIEHVEIIEDTDVLIWSDYDFPGRENWAMTNRPRWVRAQIERNRRLRALQADHRGEIRPERARRRPNPAMIKKMTYRQATAQAVANGIRLTIAA